MGKESIPIMSIRKIIYYLYRKLGYLEGARRTPMSVTTVDYLVVGTYHVISVYLYNSYKSTEQ